MNTSASNACDGDRLGKTIVFAKNNDHALFIADRFNKELSAIQRRLRSCHYV